MTRLTYTILLAGLSFTLACSNHPQPQNAQGDNFTNPLAEQLKGSWKLLSAQTVQDGKTEFQDFSKGQEMIKIINDDHFAFLRHDLKPDSKGLKNFDAGGGRYKLVEDQYTESLDFYKDQNWEGKSFQFTIRFKGDTLIQTGVEKVEKAGVDRVITEKYLKIQ